MASYYAVQVKTGQEMIIKTVLAKCLEKLYKQEAIEIIVPQFYRWKKCKKRFKLVQETLMPGYILIRCSFLTNELYYVFKRVTGVYRVFRDKIPLEEIRTLEETLSRCYFRKLELVRKVVSRKKTFVMHFNRLFQNKKVPKVIGQVGKPSPARPSKTPLLN